MLQTWVRATPTFGTCAGAILLAAHVESPPQRSLGAMDITVERNAYGRQIDSTILTAETALAGGPLEMVFIRAPRIKAVGAGVETLATREGFPTLVRSGNLLAASFHPELSEVCGCMSFFFGWCESIAGGVSAPYESTVAGRGFLRAVGERA